MDSLLSKCKKISLGILLGIFVIVSTVGLLAPEPAKAQFVVTEAASVPQTVKTILEKVWEGLKIGVLNVVSTAVSYALRKIAYDGAVWIASGGKGQGALVFKKGFTDYIKDVGNDAIGQGIDELGSKWGYNLCKIPNPQVDLALRQSLRLGLGITNTKDPTRKPSCSLTEFYKNNLSPDSFKSRYNSFVSSVEGQFNQALTYDISQGDLGIQMQSAETILRKVAEATRGSEVDVMKAGGAKDLKNPVDGSIKLPAESVKTELGGISNKERVSKSEDQINTAISTGQFQILPGALLSFFANTLAGTLLKNFQEKGILPFGIGCVGGGDKCLSTGETAEQYEGIGSVGGRRAAQQFFNDFLSARVSAVDEYNILGQLNNCPETPGTYNCRADDKLVQAAQEFNNGNPLTIKEAIDKGFLDGSKKLLPPLRAAENANLDCYKDSYCYNNVKVLRQLRILPLGFQIATELSDPDKPWTLKQVVDRFTDCDYIKDKNTGQITGIRYNPIKYPFCHLIDPNWVIKAPATRCNALAYGPSVLSRDAPDRQQDCVDLSTCVAYNKDGNCTNYAYCTRERNMWKFNADKCDAQYRTCRSFVDARGNNRAYLYRTLDTGACNKDNVGCQTYSFNQNDKGEWQSPTGINKFDYTNNGIFFNKTVSTACSSNSAGCSAFKVASSTENLLYLRQAPDYLKCYDTNLATPQTEWPKTVADLARLQPKTQCKNYAGVCIPDEVNCNWFTPVGGSSGSKIPGRFTADQVCDAKCVGYAAYREMPSNYSLGTSIAYIIPSSGNVCTVEEEGCTGFTNLGTTVNGVEKIEYFSYLRTCSLPDKARQKNFITYEGSILGGFQLKTFTLIKDASGGPEYFYRTSDDLKQYNATCNEALYKAGVASLDCRQFNDETGKIYYRLLSKTIPVSDSCAPYRLNENNLYPTNLAKAECDAQKGYWNGTQCQLCFQGGEYRDGSCFYFGLPGGINTSAGNSKSCSASVNGCRAYKGNLGNNVKNIFSENFEDATNTVFSAWKGNNLTLSPESTHVGEHSLGYNGNGEIYREISLTLGKTYDLTFWAKGSGQSLTISLKSADGKFSKDFATLGVGDAWNYYHLGPVEFEGVDTQAKLVFKNQINGKLFIDNIKMTEMIDNIYLVKNSLKVDPLCDSNLNDNLPGEALGCTAYKDTNDQVVNLTGFNHLCREGAIGCTALYNTYNTINDTGPRVYNLWLSGISNSKAQLKVGSDIASCQVVGGAQGCYANLFGHEASEIIAASSSVFTSSTIYVPADTVSSSPVYLVANKYATCNAVDLGCTAAGTEALSGTGPKFTNVIVKNDPATYETTLCQSEAVGCNAYGASDGSTMYFKDPFISGQRICAYRTGVTVNNSSFDGWFWKGVGVCSNDPNKSCATNEACGAGNTCKNIGDIPCYSNYLIEGNNYGLWSYGDKGKYQNYVGECPAEQDQCTEFQDSNDNNRSYYFLKNEKINEGNCSGSVSQREGCGLFNQVDNPNKYWVTKDSYLASEAAQYALVKPVEGTDKNPGDANIILKVQRDRECGEWLQCRSAHRVWDSQNGKWKNVCDQIGRCTKAPESADEDNISNCAEWVENDPVYGNQVLNAETYVNRDISWKGMDFAGYSLLNTYPLETLSQVNIGPLNSSPDWRLTRLIPCGDTNCAPGVDPTDFNCKTNGSPCGKGGEGLCLNGSCVVNVNGQVKDLVIESPQHICRAYPEKDSPFPNSSFIEKAKRQFEGANLCNETALSSSDNKKAYACECDYTKVKYGESIFKYWSHDDPHTTEEVILGAKNKVPAGICLGGSRDGANCESDNDCYKTKTGKPDGDPQLGPDKNLVTDGSCQKQKRLVKLLGWPGFCLEQDDARNINGEENRHPCLTWLPVNYLSGTQDIDNQHTEAGYRPPATLGGTGGAYYCLQGNASGGTDEIKSFPTGHTLETRTSTSWLSFGSIGKQNGRGTITPNELESKLTQFDIEKITLTVKDRDTEDPKEGTVVELWPNDPITPAGEPQGKFTTKDHDYEPGHIVTGKFLGKDNEYILMYGTDLKDDAKYLDEAGNVCYPAAKYNWAVDSWDGDQTRCWDLRGNVFKSLASRKGSGGDNRDPGKEGVDYFPTDMGPDGMWDTNFTTDEICRSYAPHDGGALSHGSNWHIIRFRFSNKPDEHRKFLGYDWFYCDQSQNSGRIDYEVKFKVRQWCPLVADVNADPTSLTENTSPWTDRLWKSGYFISDLLYTHEFDQLPFGSLGINSISKAFNPLYLTPFRNRQNCKGDGKGDILESHLSACEFSNNVTQKQEYQNNIAGAPYSCPNGLCVRTKPDNTQIASPAANKTKDQGKGYLSQIFARVKNVLSFNTTIDKGNYVGYSLDSNEKGIDVTENANTIPRVPWVFPAVNCDTNGRCIEDNTAPGVTINNVVDKDVRIPTPSARVFLRFFAFADSNQMPLRQINVDWDEKTGVKPEGIPGLYRNHRGFRPSVCKAGKCEVTQIADSKTCSKDADCGAGNKCILTVPGSSIGKCLVTTQLGACVTQDDCQLQPTCVDKAKAGLFGFQLDETCDNNYIQFVHVYQCSKASGPEVYHANTVDCDGKDANSTAFPRGCCIFKPKVQVKDNWGWCNGKCTGNAGNPGGEGCYDGDNIGKDNECRRDLGAWTPFAGRVILSPPLK